MNEELKNKKMSKVNLDALIPREDFEVSQDTISGQKKDTISIEDMKSDAFFYTTLRKPDFQRETSEWDTNKIVDFIESFVNGDLIPAIILWRSPAGLIFVIDGLHRLSVLYAWINNDYGDGETSRKFFGDISHKMKANAEAVRKKINEKVGLYEDIKERGVKPDASNEDLKKFRNLGALAIRLQWIEGNDSSKAERSFFKINQSTSKINN